MRNMERLGRVGCVGAVIALAMACGAFAVRGDAVDDFVTSEMKRLHVPGLSLAVVKDGKVVKVGAYGLANVELQAPVKPNTVFQIQSITKTFVSTATLMLVEEGAVGLDEPVSTYLEGTPESWKDITIRHLLSHTSGIKDFINEPVMNLRMDIMESDVFNTTVPRPLNFPPGDKYAYSNTNYHLLAMIIRKVTGNHYGAFLQRRIFDPLEMHDTRLISQTTVIPWRASGYVWDGKVLKNGQYIATSILAYGGGGIMSTAEDMAKWLIATDGDKLVKRKTMEMAWTPVTLNDFTTAGYGLGWGIGKTDGHRTVGHTGAHVTGFTSSLLKYRDDGVSVIVLTNCNDAKPQDIARGLAGLIEPKLKSAAKKKD